MQLPPYRAPGLTVSAKQANNPNSSVCSSIRSHSRYSLIKPSLQWVTSLFQWKQCSSQTSDSYAGSRQGGLLKAVLIWEGFIVTAHWTKRWLRKVFLQGGAPLHQGGGCMFLNWFVLKVGLPAAGSRVCTGGLVLVDWWAKHSASDKCQSACSLPHFLVLLTDDVYRFL